MQLTAERQTAPKSSRSFPPCSPSSSSLLRRASAALPETTLCSSRVQFCRPPLSARVLLIFATLLGMALSRIGLWSFDLAQLKELQQALDDHPNRNSM